MTTEKTADPFAIPDGPTPLETRQEERLTGIPALYKTRHEQLACELAMHMEEPEVIFERYGFGVEEASDLLESPAFAALLHRIGTEIRENGLTFKQKAKAQAEELLQHSFEIATDPHASAAVRADIIKWTAKMAGYEPTPTKDVEAKTGGGLTLNITFAGQPTQQVLAREPLTITQEA